MIEGNPMTTDEMTQPASKGDIIRIHDKLESLMQAVAVLQAKPHNERPCPDLIRHYEHHNRFELGVEANESRHIEAALNKHTIECSAAKDILALKNRMYGFLIGVGLGGGAAGGGLVMGVLKIFGQI